MHRRLGPYAFGTNDAESIEALITRVTREAIADAGIEAKDIDEIYLGHFGEGFVEERFLSSPSMGLQCSSKIAVRIPWVPDRSAVAR